MKVLLQEWSVPGKRGQLTSISKDMAQLDGTKRAVALKDDGTPIGKAFAVEIPDDHVFVEMLENDTVFLEPDEMDVIQYLNE